MVSSMAGVRAVLGQPAFTTASNQMLHFMCHGKTSAVTRTHCLKDVDNNNVECISTHEYRLDYHKHRGLEAYHVTRS
jgi:hypothetical protein